MKTNITDDFFGDIINNKDYAFIRANLSFVTTLKMLMIKNNWDKNKLAEETGKTVEYIDRILEMKEQNIDLKTMFEFFWAMDFELDIQHMPRFVEDPRFPKKIALNFDINDYNKIANRVAIEISEKENEKYK